MAYKSGIVVAAALAFTVIGVARADVITALTSSAGLNANDTVSFGQFGNGSNVGGYFTAVSNNGIAVYGGFANAEAFQESPQFAAVGSVSGTSLRTYSSSQVGGPLTLVVPGAGGVGATIGAPAAAQQGLPFAVNLALYNGASLLGTVNETSDANGDSFYVGAFDATGQNITSFTYSIASIGSGSTYGITSYNFSYNPNAGYVDPASCANLVNADFARSSPNYLLNRAQCPQKAYINGSAISGSYTVAQYNTIKNVIDANITLTPVYGTIAATYDTATTDLQSFYISPVQLQMNRAVSQSATPAACVAIRPF